MGKNFSNWRFSEDLVNSFSLAQNAPVMAYYGQSASNSDRLYTMNTKKMKSSLLEDLSKDILKDVSWAKQGLEF